MRWQLPLALLLMVIIGWFSLEKMRNMGMGRTQISPVDGMAQVFVPAGTFMMGSENGGDDERPVHDVNLDAFWMDKYEVTNEQFSIFLNDEGNRSEKGETWLDIRDESALIVSQGGEFDPKSGFGNHPVIEVTWYGAQAYCKWAGRQLPTEAEWEKAAQGHDERVYLWGDTSPDCDLLQYGGCSGATKAVGSFPDGASPYEAWDMAGNVWEWTNDWYDGGYYENSPIDNPEGPSRGGRKVLRGGSWFSTDIDVRLANRDNSVPSRGFFDVGFRCLQAVHTP